MRYRPSARFRPYVVAALRCGHWEAVDKLIDHGAHSLLRHKGSGKTITYGLHDGGNEWNGARNMAKALGDICGCSFIENRNRKRSRKKDQVSGFSIDLARSELRTFHRSTDVDALHERHQIAAAELTRLREDGSRAAIDQARLVIAELRDVETHLSKLHQPFTPMLPA